MSENVKQRFDRTIPYGEKPNSSLEEYLSFFGLNQGEISGKKILDLGGGVYRGFASASSIVEGVEIVTLEPRVVFEPTPYIKNAPVVAGVWDKLPFTDNSFDYVVSSLAVPMWVDTKEEMKRVFDEIDRVLKSGGEGRFYPPHQNIFWEELLTGDIILPSALSEESGGTQNSNVTLIGLQKLGINNLSLVSREPLPTEIIFQRQLLAYRKPRQ